MDFLWGQWGKNRNLLHEFKRMHRTLPTTFVILINFRHMLRIFHVFPLKSLRTHSRFIHCCEMWESFYSKHSTIQWLNACRMSLCSTHFNSNAEWNKTFSNGFVAFSMCVSAFDVTIVYSKFFRMCDNAQCALCMFDDVTSIRLNLNSVEFEIYFIWF